MSYLVLARKYRPATFDDVVGQEHITETIKKAIRSDRLAHAFLFSGPRGIGKTSCARILAKALNCQKGLADPGGGNADSQKAGPTDQPCGKCSACLEIAAGNSFDVLEIDGASNRGIDEIRTLRENVKFAPSYGSHKIYIVDEVHMLTTEAFNALLKTLEEPPPHVKFIFATTDPNKVPTTIISRCQRYDFRRISLKVMVDALAQISKKEKFKVEEEALYAIAKAAQGSFRDALSVLDQVSALSDNRIKSDDVYQMLGLVELDKMFELGEALATKDGERVFKVLDGLIASGKDIKQLVKDLIEHFRNLMVIKVGGKSLGRLVDHPVVVKEMFLVQSQMFSLKDILGAVELFISTQEVARITETQRIPLEIAFAKMTMSHDGERASAPMVPVKVSAVVPGQTVRDEAPPSKKFSPTSMLKNQKGMVADLSASEDDEEVEELVEVPAPDLELAVGTLDMELLRKSWDALTQALSKKKMFLATYLQEGLPIAVEDNKITVGFPKEHAFHKESLENKEYSDIVENVFSERLKRPVRILYAVVDELEGGHPVEDEPAVQNVIETFGGKIVSKWHNE